MKEDKYNEKQFIEYLDRLLAGEEISLGDDVSDEVRSSLEFARKMLAYRDDPSSDFRESLRSSLRQKLAAEEATITSKGTGFREWLANLFPPKRPVFIGITSAVVAVLLIFVGTVWYTGRYERATMPAEAPPPQAEATPPQVAQRDFSINLPSNVIPEHATFTAEMPLSTKSGQATVYRMESTDVTTRSVTELGRKLGFSGEAQFIGRGDRIAMFDGEGDDMRELIVWTASGAIEYGYVEPGKLYLPYTSELPSQKEAEQIAFNFLDEADLLPPGYRTFGDVEGESMTIAGGSHQVGKSYVEGTVPSAPSESVQEPAPTAPSASAYWLVSLPYFVEGMEATGPGSKIEVSIGDYGEVIRLLWSGRKTAPHSTASIISQKQAYNDLIQGRGSLDIPLDCKQVVIEEIQLKYWLDPPSEKQVYALPVYEFKGQCLDRNGRHLEDFTAWMEALSKTY